MRSNIATYSALPHHWLHWRSAPCRIDLMPMLSFPFPCILPGYEPASSTSRCYWPTGWGSTSSGRCPRRISFGPLLQNRKHRSPGRSAFETCGAHFRFAAWKFSLVGAFSSSMMCLPPERRSTNAPRHCARPGRPPSRHSRWRGRSIRVLFPTECWPHMVRGRLPQRGTECRFTNIDVWIAINEAAFSS